MQLTPQDLAVLRKPFAPKDHEFLRGFAYITEGAITTRIEDVDPEWTFEVLHITTRDQQVICHARMTIKGVVRDGIGMQQIQSAGEAEKGAATDALKRCARLYGIGRYLLDLPDTVKNVTDLAKWMQQPTPSNVQSMPQQPTTQDARAALGTPPGQRVETGDPLPTTPTLQPANVVKVAVKRTGQGEGKILTLALDNGLYLKERSRQLFIQAGWITDNAWKDEGEYTMPNAIPVMLKRDKTGRGWELASVPERPNPFIQDKAG